MRKALIVGELNPVLMNINQCLINEFETQMCEADLETIKKMRKLLQPDLLVISQQGIDGKEDLLILDMLKEKMPKMPIVFIETVTAKNHLSEYERGLRIIGYTYVPKKDNGTDSYSISSFTLSNKDTTI